MRAYTVCQNDWGSLLVQVTLVGRDHCLGRGGALSGGLRGGEIHHRGVFLIRMLVSSSSQSFFMTTSVCYGLWLTALLGYLFFFSLSLSEKNMLVLSCCIFQSSMTMVSGLATRVRVCECVEESMCVRVPDPAPYGLFLYNMNVDLQSVYSDLCSVSSHSRASCSCRAWQRGYCRTY